MNMLSDRVLNKKLVVEMRLKKTKARCNFVFMDAGSIPASSTKCQIRRKIMHIITDTHLQKDEKIKFPDSEILIHLGDYGELNDQEKQV